MPFCCGSPPFPLCFALVREAQSVVHFYSFVVWLVVACSFILIKNFGTEDHFCFSLSLYRDRRIVTKDTSECGLKRRFWYDIYFLLTLEYHSVNDLNMFMCSQKHCLTAKLEAHV